jgi:hypothetical protein
MTALADQDARLKGAFHGWTPETKGMEKRLAV